MNAVRMITEEKQTPAEVARNLQVSENLLYNWKNTYLEEQEAGFKGNGNLNAQVAYVRKLELENKNLKIERDI